MLHLTFAWALGDLRHLVRTSSSSSAPELQSPADAAALPVQSAPSTGPSTAETHEAAPEQPDVHCTLDTSGSCALDTAYYTARIGNKTFRINL